MYRYVRKNFYLKLKRRGFLRSAAAAMRLYDMRSSRRKFSDPLTEPLAQRRWRLRHRREVRDENRLMGTAPGRFAEECSRCVFHGQRVPLGYSAMRSVAALMIHGRIPFEPPGQSISVHDIERWSALLAEAQSESAAHQAEADRMAGQPVKSVHIPHYMPYRLRQAAREMAREMRFEEELFARGREAGYTDDEISDFAGAGMVDSFGNIRESDAVS